MLPRKVSNVFGGKERHSATARRNAPERVDNSDVYPVTRSSTPLFGYYENVNMKPSNVKTLWINHIPAKVPQGAARVDRLPSTPVSPDFQNRIALRSLSATHLPESVGSVIPLLDLSFLP